MAANHRIPNGAVHLEKIYGRNRDGETVVMSAYEYKPPTDILPKFYMVGYVERNGKVVSSTRITQQFSGKSGRARFDHEMSVSRAMLARSLQEA